MTFFFQFFYLYYDLFEMIHVGYIFLRIYKINEYSFQIHKLYILYMQNLN